MSDKAPPQTPSGAPSGPPLGTGEAIAPPISRHWRFWLAFLVATVALIYILRSVLLPFVAGAAVAYFLDPVADWLERRGLSRMMATVVITVLFLLLFLAALLLLIPALQGQISDFLGRLPAYAKALEGRVAPILEHIARVLPDAQVAKLQDGAAGMVGDAASWAIGVLRNILTSSLALINVVSLLVITPVVAFYLLRDWDKIVSTVDDWLPRAHRDVIHARMHEIDETLAGFVRGQATVCLVLGVFYAAGLTIVGLDLGLVVGLGAGLISFVPYVGSVLGFIVSIGLALAQFSELGPVLAVAGVFAFGQFVEGNFLSPYLVGGRVGLHPVWVIFALLAGGALFGFVGILLAVPVAAVAGVLLRYSLSRYLDSDLYHTRGVLPSLPPRPPSSPQDGAPGDSDPS